MKETKFALRHEESGKLLGVSTHVNAGDFCTDVCHTLRHSNEKTWHANSPEHAEWVRNNQTPWYNANYETPSHEYAAEELSVVKLEVETIETRLDITLPTFEEFARWAARGRENDYKFYMMQKKDSPEITYEFYELVQMMREKGEPK